MKYLFFDIECSNCFDNIGKMCEFGYVLTDENLKVLRSDDIPMSPGKGHDCRFNLTGRNHEKDLVLAYDHEFYYEQPEFPHFYKRIKNLIEDPDTICFAYSMANDIAHLYNSCNRYKLEPFNYICYDVQKFVAMYLEIKEQMSLHNACKEIVGPNSIVRLHEHLSRDDAEMERIIFAAICELTKKLPSEVLSESESTKVNSMEYMHTLLERGKIRQENKKIRKHYFSLVAVDEVLDAPENKGKRYNVSSKLKKDKNKMSIIEEFVKNNNYFFCGRIKQTDFFLVYDEDNREELLKGFKYPFEGKVLTYQEFLETIK